MWEALAWYTFTLRTKKPRNNPETHPWMSLGCSSRRRKTPEKIHSDAFYCFNGITSCNFARTWKTSIEILHLLPSDWLQYTWKELAMSQEEWCSFEIRFEAVINYWSHIFSDRLKLWTNLQRWFHCIAPIQATTGIKYFGLWFKKNTEVRPLQMLIV